MAIPSYDKLIEHVLRVLTQHPDGVPTAVVYEEVAKRLGLTPEDKAELLPSKAQVVYKNRIGWAHDRLKRVGFSTSPQPRIWRVTETGRAFAGKHAAVPPEEIERIARPSDLGGKIDRNDPEVARACVEAMYPEEHTRTACLRWLANAVEYVHEREPACWGVTLKKRLIRFNVGRMLSLDLMAGEVRLGLAVESLTPDDKGALDEQGEWSEGAPLSVSPDCRTCVLPTSLLLERAESLRPAWLEFLRIAIRTGRQTPFVRSHSPGVITFIEGALGRALPRPKYRVSDDGEGGDHDGEDDDPAETEPTVPAAVKADSSALLFKETSPSVGGLLHELDSGDLGLPDIQRPFVWNATKVRDLIDSMYKGFPVGYLLFWETPPSERGSKAIGLESKGHEPKRLIVDGQQRLTSLYAVLRGKPVLDDEFKNTTIEIAFRPRDSRFEVTSAAIRKDPEYITSISDVWRTATYTFTTAFLQTLEQRRSIAPEDRDAIAHNIGRLAQIDKYTFSALEILSDVDEEAVADIFVRINSQGVKLNQADFILTLLSVAWDQGRRDLEAFARACSVPPKSPSSPSPYNHFIKPSADQLLRVAIAIGFHRGKLRSAYQVLRGKDPDTGRMSLELRKVQFARLQDAQSKVLNLTHWHGFMAALLGAGVRSGAMVSSEGALLFAYAFYLIGKLQCGVDDRTLKRLIGRWFFVTSLTGRYTGSSETALESDLGRVKDVTTPAPFIETLEGLIAAMLPDGYWDLTLPAAFETSGSNSPAMLAYLAAQNRLGAPVLFSDLRIADLLDPALSTKRKTIEQHHLFPKKWLERQGITEPKRTNQAANLAMVEWVDNSDMSDSPPAEYLPGLRKKFSDAAWERMGSLHALPAGWELMGYDEFLVARRALMAQIIRQGFAALSGSGDGAVTLAEGTPDEQKVWVLIPKVELRLREVVSKAYRGKWEGNAEARIRSVLGEKSWEIVERNRDKDSKKGGASANHANVLDYVYLRQLVDLLVANEVWEAFRPAFKEKQRPVALVDSITAVRNDMAHFRSVAPLELDRCRIACTDLLNLLQLA